MAMQTRLPFELDGRAETGLITALGGVRLLIEAFRVSGAAAVLDERVVIKRRKRGLRPSELVEGLFSLWASARGRGAGAAARPQLSGAPDRQGLSRRIRRGGPALVAG